MASQPRIPRRKSTSFKIGIFGINGVGKTSLLYRFCMDVFPQTYDPCGDDCYRKQETLDGGKVMVEYLDTAGQEEYIALREQWMRDCEGALLVYSISSRESFDKIQGLRENFKQVKTKQGAWDGFTICIIGNKIDLRDTERIVTVELPSQSVIESKDGSRGAERLVTTEEGKDLAKKFGCIFMECSAKMGVGYHETVMATLRDMKIQKEKLEADAKARIESKRREEQKAEKLRNNRWRRVLARLSS